MSLSNSISMFMQTQTSVIKFISIVLQKHLISFASLINLSLVLAVKLATFLYYFIFIKMLGTSK